MKTACFTGHRSVEKDQIPSLSEDLDRIVEDAYQQGYRCFLCGGALGFDTLAALAVLRYRENHSDVLLHLAIPCEDQAAFWKTEDIRRYQMILEQADYVYPPFARHYRKGCMMQRNRLMVDCSSLCICYWDGRKRGGTFYTLRYAIHRNLEIINLFRSNTIMREEPCCSMSIFRSAARNADTVRFVPFHGKKLRHGKTSG